jgi:hypothetical protein
VGASSRVAISRTRCPAPVSRPRKAAASGGQGERDTDGREHPALDAERQAQRRDEDREDDD